MNDTASFHAGNGKTALVEGPMTLSTVTDLFEQAGGVFEGSSAPDEIDLAAVSRVDSSGLALLLEWQARRQKSGGTLRVSRAPEDLVRISSLCSAQELLHLGTRDAEDEAPA